jgi:hypothetical protein
LTLKSLVRHHVSEDPKDPNKHQPKVFKITHKTKFIVQFMRSYVSRGAPLIFMGELNVNTETA